MIATATTDGHSFTDETLARLRRRWRSPMHGVLYLSDLPLHVVAAAAGCPVEFLGGRNRFAGEAGRRRYHGVEVWAYRLFDGTVLASAVSNWRVVQTRVVQYPWRTVCEDGAVDYDIVRRMTS